MDFSPAPTRPPRRSANQLTIVSNSSGFELTMMLKTALEGGGCGAGGTGCGAGPVTDSLSQPASQSKASSTRKMESSRTVEFFMRVGIGQSGLKHKTRLAPVPAKVCYGIQ